MKNHVFWRETTFKQEDNISDSHLCKVLIVNSSVKFCRTIPQGPIQFQTVWSDQRSKGVQAHPSSVSFMMSQISMLRVQSSA